MTYVAESVYELNPMDETFFNNFYQKRSPILSQST